MSSRRAERTAELIHAELARALREDLRDPRVGSISITHVKATDDLRLARVYYTPFGGKPVTKAVTRGIRSASGFLRSQVAKALGLRHAPELLFLVDDGIDEAVRMTALLQRMAQGHTESEGPTTENEEGEE